ncbi:hypothetical protein J6590_090125 [Homalodisca vitripennis]|nr:hypothetical protein J6590_090125 [Homalodisca vitripennis]
MCVDRVSKEKRRCDQRTAYKIIGLLTSRNEEPLHRTSSFSVVNGRDGGPKLLSVLSLLCDLMFHYFMFLYDANERPPEGLEEQSKGHQLRGISQTHKTRDCAVVGIRSVMVMSGKCLYQVSYLWNVDVDELKELGAVK